MNKHIFIEEPEGEFCELKLTYEELIKMYNKIYKLQQELQRKNNIINDLKSSIADYQEAVGDYQDELKRKNNNWNELKEFIKNELNHNVDKEKSFMGYQCKIILDKIKELENEKK